MLVENPRESEQKNTEQQVQTQPVSTDRHLTQGELVLASRFKRFIAAWANVLFCYLLFFLGGFLLGGIGLLIGLIVAISIQIYMLNTYSQTLGKKLLGLQVIDYATLQPLSVGRYLVREVVENVFALFSIPTLISAILAFVNKERRSLVDMVMSTIVVKKG